MSALIRILEEQRKHSRREGLKISKSDLSYGSHDALDSDIDLVVCSTAIPKTDPDFIELESRGLEFWHRRDMLQFLAQDFKQIVATGTHGKTTCSAMISHILMEAGLDPSFAVGGILANYQTNGHAGGGEYFVLEGDESDQSFTISKPQIALITSIEPDHLENYPGGYDEIKEKFFIWLDTAPIKVLCLDDPALLEYFENHQSEPGLYGYSSAEAEELDIKLAMPGKYNRLNALAAAKVAGLVGVDLADALQALTSFKGIKRRFELINQNYRDENILVYDDYAHHPTELKALMQGALEIAKRDGRRLVMVYQPHHPERTQQFWDEFKHVMASLPDEHLLLVADVYVARSKHIEGIDSKRLVAEIARDNVIYLQATSAGLDVQGNYADMKSALCPFIEKHLQANDLLMITGAGNISKIVQAFVEKPIS